MNQLTKELLDGINRGDEESILGAEETAMFLNFGIDNSGIVEPYLSRFKEQPPSKKDGIALKEALASYLEKEGLNASVSAVWALGKYEDPNYEKLYLKLLELHIEKLMLHNRGLHNCLEALHRLGKVPPEPKIDSPSEVQANENKARAYLREINVLVPI